jgi:hypothetical protein
MRRRVLLALSGLVAVSGCLEGDDARNDSSDTNSGDDAPTLPIDVRTVDAPGSDAGTEPVPREEQVTFLNFTRLLCPTSEGLIETIGDVNDELEETHDVGSTGDVRFLSAVDPNYGGDPSDGEVADWWDEHGGRWPVGIDDDGDLGEYFEVRELPSVVAIDGDGEVHWRESGGTSSGNMVTGIERALETEPVVDDPETAPDGAGNDSDETTNESDD